MNPVAEIIIVVALCILGLMIAWAVIATLVFRASANRVERFAQQADPFRESHPRTPRRDGSPFSSPYGRTDRNPPM